MSISLKNIAEELGLSKTTVSWVLSGRGDERNISRETQERVKECARQLNYVPNSLARSLNLGYSRTIGLIVPSISDSFYANVANKIEEVAHNAGYSLMIASSNSEAQMEEELIRVFVEKQVDGIILAPMKLSRDGVEYLVRERVPVVLIDRYYPDLEVSHVVIDNKEASRRLVEGMLAHEGCRKIAIVTTNPHLLTMDMRRAGYEEALASHGIAADPRLNVTVSVSSYREELPDALDGLFGSVPDVDGFFFTTHILLEEAVRYFKGRGTDMTDGDMSFASMRSEPLLNIIIPHLKAAGFPEAEMGETAFNILLDHIADRQNDVPSRPRSVVLKCSLPDGL